MRRALLLLTLVCGCSFPEPTIVDEPLDSSIDSFVAEAGEDGQADSSLDETTDATDGGEVSTDARPDGDASDATSDALDCDKDKDGFKAKGGSCGGNDCDDNDPNAKPGVTMFLTFNATGKPHLGDWNCNGSIEKQFPINVNCGLLGGGACPATKGFTGDPTCGTTGDYVQCATSGILCVPSTTKMEIQGCK